MHFKNIYINVPSSSVGKLVWDVFLYTYTLLYLLYTFYFAFLLKSKREKENRGKD